MEIQLIGENAGILWNVLNAQENKTMEISKFKKETKLNDAQFWAAAGWLAKEGKLVHSAEKKGKKTVETYRLAE